MNNKILISLSGGLDSCVLLAQLLQEGNTCEAVSFTYGSKHNKWENKAARAIAKYYGVKLHEIDITSVMKGFNSALLKSDEREIPQGHYEQENMVDTVVPCRNLIFGSILAGLADSLDMSMIALGVHAGDHAIYPDCRKEFIEKFDKTVFIATSCKIIVIAPFLYFDKIKIVEMGQKLNVPFELTRTCYTDQQDACGKCGSCNERLEAFDKNNSIDPIAYQGE